MPRTLPGSRWYVAVPIAASLVFTAAIGAQAPAKAHAVFVDGQAQIVPAFEDSSKWIHQDLWVQTDFDTDHDGKPDRVHVDVSRPCQTETEGLKVPVIMGSSPYYAGTGRPQVNWDVQVELGTVPPPRGKMNNPPFKSPRDTISMALVKEWVPRGFAVVHNEAPGTGLSAGCPTVGDYPEREAPAAVIDWLNGRAKGYTTKTGDVEVKATVDHRQGRDDGHVVRRDAAARRRHAGAEGPRGRHSGVAQHHLLPLLPHQRPGALARTATSAKTSTCSTTSSPAATPPTALAVTASGRTASLPGRTARTARPAT